jgi:hypothetical protein
MSPLGKWGVAPQPSKKTAGHFAIFTATASCLVAAEQMRLRAASRLLLEINVGEHLAAGVTDDEKEASEAKDLLDARCPRLSPWPMHKDVLKHKPTLAPVQRAAALAAFDASSR